MGSTNKVSGQTKLRENKLMVARPEERREEVEEEKFSAVKTVTGTDVEDRQ